MGREVQYHAALASPTRRQVLDAIVAASGPLDVTAVADAAGIHVTTARFHLDQLEAAGLIERRMVPEPRRGRPRVRFVPTGAVRDDDAREQLIDVLASVIADDAGGGDRSAQAGRRWAEALEGPANSSPGLAQPVSGLVDALSRLGFEPEVSPTADAIRLLACPFRDAARVHPEVVCAVHRGLIDRTLERAGGSIAAELVPFVEPELCLVRLKPGARTSLE
ncbi:helix-turn-helix transcriptional regulator [Agromyces neolithicus]|uniref:Helix-turn-helix domain-containing protein n=1 Tax=Agromyces neolithicus TaxID=269420 RepID=A0ABN2M4W9_9MICO